MRAAARALAVGLVLVGPALVPMLAAPTPACASGSGPHAALVVDTGSTLRSFCVALDDSTVSGLHLIELAGAQEGLSYGFGFGGQAVCRLAGTGPAGGDCFASYPAFWGYWHGDGRGGWSWSAAGPAGSTVHDGAIEGWVWGTGDTAATHARPPSTTTAQVCAPTSPSASPAPSTTSPDAARPSSSPAAAAGVATAPTSARHTGSVAPARSGAPLVATGSPLVAVRAAASSERPPGGGPPAGLFAALGLGLALAAGGWLRLRSTRKAGG